MSDTQLTGAQFARDMFDHYVGKYNKAAEAVRNSAQRLPDFFDPESHTTDCDHVECLYVVEPGYERWEKADGWSDVPGDEKFMHAHTRGYSAYGEQGIVEYLECAAFDGGCGLRWRMPEEMGWD